MSDLIVIKRKESIMNIKQFSELSGFSPDTLKYYEKIGLFDNIKRDPRGYRDYSKSEIEWAKFLNRLKTTGMSVKNMKKFTNLLKKGNSTIKERRKMLEEHQNAVLANLEKITNMLEKIKYKIEFYKKLEKN